MASVIMVSGRPSATPLEEVRTEVVAGYGPMVRAAVAGDGKAALDALDAFRVLCAHRADGVRATGLFGEWLHL